VGKCGGEEEGKGRKREGGKTKKRLHIVALFD